MADPQGKREHENRPNLFDAITKFAIALEFFVTMFDNRVSYWLY